MPVASALETMSSNDDDDDIFAITQSLRYCKE